MFFVNYLLRFWVLLNQIAQAATPMLSIETYRPLLDMPARVLSIGGAIGFDGYGYLHSKELSNFWYQALAPAPVPTIAPALVHTPLPPLANVTISMEKDTTDTNLTTIHPVLSSIVDNGVCGNPAVDLLFGSVSYLGEVSYSIFMESEPEVEIKTPRSTGPRHTGPIHGSLPVCDLADKQEEKEWLQAIVNTTMTMRLLYSTSTCAAVDAPRTQDTDSNESLFTKVAMDRVNVTVLIQMCAVWAGYCFGLVASARAMMILSVLLMLSLKRTRVLLLKWFYKSFAYVIMATFRMNAAKLNRDPEWAWMRVKVGEMRDARENEKGASVLRFERAEGKGEEEKETDEFGELPLPVFEWDMSAFVPGLDSGAVPNVLPVSGSTVEATIPSPAENTEVEERNTNEETSLVLPAVSSSDGSPVMAPIPILAPVSASTSAVLSLSLDTPDASISNASQVISDSLSSDVSLDATRVNDSTGDQSGLGEGAECTVVDESVLSGLEDAEKCVQVAECAKEVIEVKKAVDAVILTEVEREVDSASSPTFDSSAVTSKTFPILALTPTSTHNLAPTPAPASTSLSRVEESECGQGDGEAVKAWMLIPLPDDDDKQVDVAEEESLSRDVVRVEVKGLDEKHAVDVGVVEEVKVAEACMVTLPHPDDEEISFFSAIDTLSVPTGLIETQLVDAFMVPLPEVDVNEGEFFAREVEAEDRGSVNSSMVPLVKPCTIPLPKPHEKELNVLLQTGTAVVRVIQEVASSAIQPILEAWQIPLPEPTDDEVGLLAPLPVQKEGSATPHSLDVSRGVMASISCALSNSVDDRVESSARKQASTVSPSPQTPEPASSSQAASPASTSDSLSHSLTSVSVPVVDTPAQHVRKVKLHLTRDFQVALKDANIACRSSGSLRPASAPEAGSSTASAPSIADVTTPHLDPLTIAGSGEASDVFVEHGPVMQRMRKGERKGGSGHPQQPTTLAEATEQCVVDHAPGSPIISSISEAQSSDSRPAPLEDANVSTAPVSAIEDSAGQLGQCDEAAITMRKKTYRGCRGRGGRRSANVEVGDKKDEDEDGVSPLSTQPATDSANLASSSPLLPDDLIPVGSPVIDDQLEAESSKKGRHRNRPKKYRPDGTVSKAWLAYKEAVSAREQARSGITAAEADEVLVDAASEHQDDEPSASSSGLAMSQDLANVNPSRFSLKRPHKFAKDGSVRAAWIKWDEARQAFRAGTAGDVIDESEEAEHGKDGEEAVPVFSLSAPQAEDKVEQHSNPAPAPEMTTPCSSVSVSTTPVTIPAFKFHRAPRKLDQSGEIRQSWHLWKKMVDDEKEIFMNALSAAGMTFGEYRKLDRREGEAVVVCQGVLLGKIPATAKPVPTSTSVPVDDEPAVGSEEKEDKGKEREVC